MFETREEAELETVWEGPAVGIADERKGAGCGGGYVPKLAIDCHYSKHHCSSTLRVKQHIGSE
jgi:hypothetical protein